LLPLVQSPDNKKLLDHYAACAGDLGITGGCADSGFTAGVGTPTVCAVGPIGCRARRYWGWRCAVGVGPSSRTASKASRSGIHLSGGVMGPGSRGVCASRHGRLAGMTAEVNDGAAPRPPISGLPEIGKLTSQVG
jgi:hypothetical protein